MSICYNKKYERDFVRMMIKQGHHCERVAGSGSGKDSVCDCILFMNGKVYMVEVKATKEPKFYMRMGVKRQLDKLKEVAEKCGVIPMLAVKFKGRRWKLDLFS